MFLDGSELVEVAQLDSRCGLHTANYGSVAQGSPVNITKLSFAVGSRTNLYQAM